MTFLKALQDHPLIYDGSKGVMLQNMGLTSGEVGETWNALYPEKVRAVYQGYLEAGSDVLQTNTFSANRAALEAHGLGDKVEELNTLGVKLAREVSGEKFVAASAGPTGKMMAPFGDLTFPRAYEIFAEQSMYLERAGANAIHFETFMDIGELRCAILAAKENTRLPVIASVALEASGKTLMGSSAEICARVCAAAGADVVGVNCSCGPEMLLAPIREMAKAVNLPLVAKPNAGLPETVDGKTVYRETPEQFGALAGEFLASGVRLLGGCCGSGSEHIRALRRAAAGAPSMRPEAEPKQVLCSYSELLEVGEGVEEVRLDAAQDPEDLMDDAMDGADEGDALVLDFGSGADYDVEAMTAQLCSMVRTPVIAEGDPNTVMRFLRCYPGIAGFRTESETAAKMLGKYGLQLQL